MKKAVEFSNGAQEQRAPLIIPSKVVKADQTRKEGFFLLTVTTFNSRKRIKYLVIDTA